MLERFTDALASSSLRALELLLLDDGAVGQLGRGANLLASVSVPASQLTLDRRRERLLDLLLGSRDDRLDESAIRASIVGVTAQPTSLVAALPIAAKVATTSTCSK